LSPERLCLGSLPFYEKVNTREKLAPHNPSMGDASGNDAGCKIRPPRETALPDLADSQGLELLLSLDAQRELGLIGKLFGQIFAPGEIHE
jgi:hypothetical protein